MTSIQPPTLKDQVLSKIATESIAPTPRWHFVLRKGVVCGVGVVSMGVGVLAVVAIIFEMRNAWWEHYEATHESLLTFTVEALPVVWLVSLIVFSGLLYASVRHMRRGYRYAVHTLVLASIGISGVGGVAVYALGGGRFADEAVGSFMPFHQPLIERERTRWMDPDDGRLTGIVREVPFTESVLWLEGADGVTYQVGTGGFTPTERQTVRVGDFVRVIGIPTTAPNILEGCIVFIQNGDILERLHERGVIGKSVDGERERKPLFARSTECRGIRPYARLQPNE